MNIKLSRGGKYCIPLLLMLLGNELISTIALIGLVGAFLSSIVDEAARRGI